MLGGDRPIVDPPRTSTLVWKGPNLVEMHRKSSTSNEEYVVPLERIDVLREK